MWMGHTPHFQPQQYGNGRDFGNKRVMQSRNTDAAAE